MAKAKTSHEHIGYKELKAEIRNNQCRDLYVLTGEETFLIEKLIEGLSELLIAPGSEALDRVVLQGWGQPGRLDLDKLKAEVMTPPFLSRRKLVIVRQSGWFASGAGNRSAPAEADTQEENGQDSDDVAEPAGSMPNASAQKNRQEALIRLFEKLPDSACLVLLEQKVDRRLKTLVSAIEKRGVLADIGKEQPKTLLLWVDAECRRRGLKLAAGAAESLVDRCDAAMQVIWQELSKIFLYCSYAKTTDITLDLIADLSLPDLRGSIFDLTDALSAGQTGRAMILADTLISQKQPVQLIQFMLARHLRQLICAAELGKPDRIAAELKVMPFVAARLAGQARKLPIPLLEDLYGRCFEMDMQVKTGKINDRLALEILLAGASEQMKNAVRH